MADSSCCRGRAPGLVTPCTIYPVSRGTAAGRLGRAGVSRGDSGGPAGYELRRRVVGGGGGATGLRAEVWVEVGGAGFVTGLPERTTNSNGPRKFCRWCVSFCEGV